MKKITKQKPLRLFSVMNSDGWITYRDFFLARSHYYAKRCMIEDIWGENFFRITDFQEHELTSKVHKEFDDLDLSFLPDYKKNSNAFHIDAYEDKDWYRRFYDRGWMLKYHDEEDDVKPYSLSELMQGVHIDNERSFYEKII